MDRVSPQGGGMPDTPCWESASPRERDAWVASQVTKIPGEPPAYTTDAAADFSVLRHVRRKWAWPDQIEFAEALWDIYRCRWEANESGPVGLGDLLHVRYHATGDYSRAAYEVLKAAMARMPPRAR
jgi:hypothetical protein